MRYLFILLLSIFSADPDLKHSCYVSHSKASEYHQKVDELAKDLGIQDELGWYTSFEDVAMRPSYIEVKFHDEIIDRTKPYYRSTMNISTQDQKVVMYNLVPSQAHVVRNFLDEICSCYTTQPKP